MWLRRRTLRFWLILSMQLNYAFDLMNGDGISDGLILWSALLILLAGGGMEIWGVYDMFVLLFLFLFLVLSC